jgi:hypothetical protein
MLLEIRLVRIVLRLALVDDVRLVDVPMDGIFDDAYLNLRYLVPVLLDIGDRIFEMPLDSRAQLPRFPGE